METSSVSSKRVATGNAGTATVHVREYCVCRLIENENPRGSTRPSTLRGNKSSATFGRHFANRTSDQLIPNYQWRTRVVGINPKLLLKTIYVYIIKHHNLWRRLWSAYKMRQSKTDFKLIPLLSFWFEVE